MPDVHQLLAELRDLSTAVNNELEEINKRITAFEKSIYDLRLGITVWMSTPISEPYWDGTGLTQWTTHLGWTKHDGRDWGFSLREQAFKGSKKSDPRRLRDASREDRLLALRAMPDFLVEVKAAAERVLKDLKEANTGTVPRTPVKG
jgi:hypothetical protein